jgi:hypothetical protein
VAVKFVIAAWGDTILTVFVNDAAVRVVKLFVELPLPLLVVPPVITFDIFDI